MINTTSYAPQQLSVALDMLGTAEMTPYAGGSDLMIPETHEKPFLYLHKIPELKQLYVESGELHIGAALTYRELLAASETPAILKEAVSQIAAPAIRNVATLGGNIANASPKGDGALVCAVADCKLVLESKDGRRTLPIMDFYTGRNRTARAANELLVEIIMPLAHLDNYVFEKVGARGALAISRVSFAGLISVEDGVVQHFATAFGAVADCVLRPRELDETLVGMSVAKAKEYAPQYLDALAELIQPIRGRVSAEYRKRVCLNLAQEFLLGRLG